MEDDGSINIGDVVYSKAGRDKGGYFIVVWRKGEYAGLCDGDLRKTDKPKKKKVKHLSGMDYNSEFVRDKILSLEKVTNAELRRGIAEFEETRSVGGGAPGAPQTS